MIRVNKDAPLSTTLIRGWIKKYMRDYVPRLLDSRAHYLNTNGLELPYAKKIVTISAAATVGDGITVDVPEDESEKLSDSETDTLKEILKLFKRQSIGAEDLAVITDGCTYGYGIELCYMSDDAKPVPKSKRISPLNAFVVFDDTVEDNGLYGVYFNEVDGKSLDISVYDDTNIYHYTLGVDIKKFVLDSYTPPNYMFDKCFAYSPPIYDSLANNIGEKNQVSEVRETNSHNMGRMPMTMYFNNSEMQGDFEQVKKTILWRNIINKLAMDDAETVAQNLIVLLDNELAGDTSNEKRKTLLEVMHTKVLELLGGGDAKILTKDSSFNTIAVYGKDLDTKIYDLSMVADFTAPEFAGNLTGVSLRLKLFPFKRMVKNKDFFIEKLYRRRLKMYQYAIRNVNSNLAEVDIGVLNINIHRTWEENELEIAQTISTLQATGKFSDEYLVEKMPDADYEVEKARIEKQNKNNALDLSTSANALNTNTGDINAMVRLLLGQGASDGEL